MTREELQTIFESEFKWDNWKKVMNFVFPEFKFNLVQTDLTRDTKAHKKSAGYIKEHGTTQLASPEMLTLCEILVNDNVRLDRNIKSVRSLVADLAVPNYQTVIAVFHNKEPKKWRFTLVVKEFTGSNKVFDKKPDSYTYVFGVGEKGRTASERFLKLAGNTNKTLKDLEEAFSVEALSKKFFKEYKDIYQQFVEDIIKNPSRLALFKETSKEKQEKNARDFVKKMMGRLVFLYFLQKKGWLGCKTKWKEGDEGFMKTFVEKAKLNDLFYHHYLEPLFFDTLNDKRTKQGEDCIIQKTNFGKVPYLNGGLFEKDDNHPKSLTLKWEIFEAFFETLNNYNFTIIEDDPEFKEVAVDPEMLGHIFENLLEDNKDKGAYYTPKEIVHYMCQESLYEYLRTYLQQNDHWPQEESDAQKLRQSLQRFVKQKLASGVIDYDKQLAKALKEVKICDPAIGSGAFPMGLLNEIYHCVHKLHDESPDKVGDVWGIGKVWQGNKIKLNIIQNSIYGVDIEKGAVDIARLRFWLSLIIDETEPKPLPNLDFKIVVGDSLVPKFENNALIIDWDIKLAKIESERPELKSTQTKLNEEIQKRQRENLDKVVNKQKQYFNADEADKARIQNEIQLLKLEIVLGQVRQELLKTGRLKESYGQTGLFASPKKQPKKHLEILEKETSLKHLEKVITKKITNKDTAFSHFDWRLDFPEVLNEALTDRPGFDIVIGNPPYGADLDDFDKDFLKVKYANVADRIRNSYLYFIGFGYEITKQNGSLFYIVPNEFLFQIYMGKAREYYLQESKFLQAVNLGLNVFDAIVPSCIVGISKNKVGINYKIKVADLRDKTSLRIDPSDFISVDRELVQIYPNATFSFDIEKIKIVGKLTALGVPFGDFCETVANGISTSCDEIYIVDDEIVNKYKLEEDYLFPCLRGNQVSKFTIPGESPDKILYITKDIDLKRTSNTFKYLEKHKDLLIEKSVEKREGKRDWKILFRPREPELFSSPKLVFRQTGDKPICAVDNNSMYCIDSLNIAQLKSEFRSLINYFEAICNSKLMSFFYQEISQEKGRVLAQIKPQRLRALPIRVEMELTPVIEKLVSAIRVSKDDTQRSNILNRIDLLVYKLYQLNIEEIKIVDPESSITDEVYNSVKID